MYLMHPDALQKHNTTRFDEPETMVLNLMFTDMTIYFGHDIVLHNILQIRRQQRENGLIE